MAWSRENYCVGCPQGCIHCGRDRDVLIPHCDKCDATEVYYYGNRMYCIHHMIEQMMTDEEIKEIPYSEQYLYDDEKYTYDELVDYLGEELEMVEELDLREH